MILAGAFAALLAALVCERLALERRLSRIPLRICVTGTRGKSSVARMLASVLRCDGRSVLAKTTGSEAVYVLPDGSEACVPRRGHPSILEQKRLIRLGAHLHADCLIAEIMSIRPDTHRIEGRQILKPHIVAVTNVRRDHTDTMGESEGEIAAVLSTTVPRGATLFLPENAPGGPFAAAVARAAGRMVIVGPGTSEAALASAPDLGRAEFSDNLDLVCAIARHLGISDETVVAGIRSARLDAGHLRIWAYREPGASRTCYFVNAFAANDPHSTERVLLRVRERLPRPARNIAGILNLREDRIARSVQWIEALNGSAAFWFRRVFLTGFCPLPLRRRLPSAVILRDSSPREATLEALAAMDGDCMLFGFGNFSGFGQLLSRHWAEIGEEYGI